MGLEVKFLMIVKKRLGMPSMSSMGSSVPVQEALCRLEREGHKISDL